MATKFITVTPQRLLFDREGGEHWVNGVTTMINTRYIVTILCMSNGHAQISLKDGSHYIVPSSQITGVTE